MKLAIVGYRKFDDYNYFKKCIDEWIQQHESPSYIVSGGAKGADALAKRYSKENNIPIIEFLPEYNKYPGNIAPLKRNEQIVEEADNMIAFLSTESRGTKNTIKLANDKGIPVKIIDIMENDSSLKNCTKEKQYLVKAGYK